MLAEEEKRYEKLLVETKNSHDSQIAELKLSQDKEKEKVERDHQEYLETARENFEREKIKYEV